MSSKAIARRSPEIGACDRAFLKFQWRTQTYEYVNDRLAIDLLFGSEGPRTMLEDGAAAADVIATFRANETAFAQERAEHLIY